MEVPWELGPAPGRYLVRAEHQMQDDAQHVLVIEVLGARQRRLRDRVRPTVSAEPQPDPAPVPTSRATVIDVGSPFADEASAGSWLKSAGESDLRVGLRVLERALHAYRLVMADPYIQPVGRRQLLVARVGYGAGEEVADGRWTQARELRLPEARQGRQKVLQPQARLAALLGAREQALACEELALRARLDLDAERTREAALGLMVALDAAIAELSVDLTGPVLQPRLEELRAQRGPVARIAQAALSGPLDEPAAEAVRFSLGRIEAALRARAVANA